MPFIEIDDVYQKWRYMVSELFILYPNGSRTVVPANRVKSFTIVHDFEQNLFPVFRLELVLASTTYYKIIKNKKDIKFKIRVQKYYTKLDSTEKSLMRDWINDTFDLILDDNDYNPEEPLIKERKSQDYENISDKEMEDDLFEVDNTIEFFLFKSKLVDRLNTVVNAVISNATINDGIQYIATKVGLNNLLMSNPHNITNYKELIIPPLKAKQAIKFLDTYYGLYKTGMLFYCDMVEDITYILEYSSKCTAYQFKELKETDILIPLKSNKYSSDLCSLYRRDNKEKYFIIGGHNITIKNETISYNAYAETDAKIINTYSGDITTSNSTASVKDTKSVKIIENNTENIWFPDIYNALINAKNTVIEIMLSNYDISALSPNKMIKIVFEDSALATKYKKGVLMISKTDSLVREGESFILSTIVKFKQI